MTTKQTKTKTKRRPNALPTAKVDLILAMREAGKTFAQIGQALGIAKSTALQYVKKDLRKEQGSVDRPLAKALQHSEANVLRSKCALLLDGITPEKISKANINTVAVAYGILFDKRRLLDGKSTQNQSISATIRLAHGQQVRGARIAVTNALGDEALPSQRQEAAEAAGTITNSERAEAL